MEALRVDIEQSKEPRMSARRDGGGAERGGRGVSVRARVIPCLDVANGRVVKGVNFVDLKDAGDPVEQARAYDAAGADELCFLHITPPHEARGTINAVVRRTPAVCFMPFTRCRGGPDAAEARPP